MIPPIHFGKRASLQEQNQIQSIAQHIVPNVQASQDERGQLLIFTEDHYDGSTDFVTLHSKALEDVYQNQREIQDVANRLGRPVTAIIHVKNIRGILKFEQFIDNLVNRINSFIYQGTFKNYPIPQTLWTGRLGESLRVETVYPGFKLDFGRTKDHAIPPSKPLAAPGYVG